MQKDDHGAKEKISEGMSDAGRHPDAPLKQGGGQQKGSKASGSPDERLKEGMSDAGRQGGAPSTGAGEPTRKS